MSRWVLWLFLLVFQLGAQAGELADLLRGGHHVLLMRHAYAPGVGDPPGFSLERCETQRLLNEAGERQAAGLGQWLRAQGVDSAHVFSSIWCRCQQTAKLLQLGPVAVESSLGSFFNAPRQADEQNRKLQKFIAASLQTKGDKALILVTHHVNIRQFMGQDVGVGDMVLARVDALGRMQDYKLIPSPRL